MTRRDVTKALVQDAEAAGYKAIVVTVDAPRLGEPAHMRHPSQPSPENTSHINVVMMPPSARHHLQHLPHKCSGAVFKSGPLHGAWPRSLFAGNREGDERNQFSLPQGLSLRNLERITAATGGTQHVADDGSKFGRHFSGLIDASLQWDIVPWLKSVTSLPVLVKVRMPRCIIYTIALFLE